MSNRFRDTEIWEQPWYRRLSPQDKCVWDYLCDKCDNAGVWEIDVDTMQHYLNASRLDLTQTIEALNADRREDEALRVAVIDSGRKVLLPGFVAFQTKSASLNPDSHPHRKILSLLEKHGLSMSDGGLVFETRVPSSLPTTLCTTLRGRAKEGEKELEKELDLVGGGVGGEKKGDSEVAEILALWSAHFGSDPTATQAKIWIKRRLGLAPQSKTGAVLLYEMADLRRAIENYAEHVRVLGHEKTYAVRNFFNLQSAYCESFADPAWVVPRLRAAVERVQSITEGDPSAGLTF